MSEEQNQTNAPEPKVIALIAYLTIVGWLVAYVLNNKNNNPSSFLKTHMRMALGTGLIGVVGFALSGIFIGWIIYIGFLILAIIGVINALQEKDQELPIVGQYFNQWFGGI